MRARRSRRASTRWWRHEHGLAAAGRALGPIGVAGVLILKFAAKLEALLLLAPKLKVLSTAGSMLLSVAAYALIWGWRFGIGF